MESICLIDNYYFVKLIKLLNISFKRYGMISKVKSLNIGMNNVMIIISIIIYIYFVGNVLLFYINKCNLLYNSYIFNNIIHFYFYKF